MLCGCDRLTDYTCKSRRCGRANFAHGHRIGSTSDVLIARYQFSGTPYTGPQPNSVFYSVSATVNGATAQVLSAGLPPFSYGIYQVQMVLPTTLKTNPAVQVYVAQNAFISNIVTIPVGPARQTEEGLEDLPA